MIAQELWAVAAAWPRGCWSWAIRMSDRCLDFCIEVSKAMGLEEEFLYGREVDEDVLSEAIQYAEALEV